VNPKRVSTYLVVMSTSGVVLNWLKICSEKQGRAMLNSYNVNANNINYKIMHS